MLWLPTAMTTTLLGSLLLAIVYAFLYYEEREKYLLAWAISWGFYSVRFIFSLLSFYHPGSFLWIIVSQIAVLVSGEFLLRGTFLFINKRWKKHWTILTVLASSWVIVSVLVGAPLLVYSAPSFTLLTVIYIVTGISIFQMKGTASGFFSKGVGIGFIIWGIHKADFPFLRSVEWFAPYGYMIATFLEFWVAIGILLIYFQKNREELIQSEKKLALLNVDLEARVAERTSQLEDVVKEMESFSYSVSHDLRAPLRSITGFSEILLQDFSSDLQPEAKMYLDLVIKNSFRMQELIEDMLMLSRIGRQDINPEVVNLSELSQQVFESLQQESDLGAEVNFEAKPSDNVVADRRLMQVLLSNLISNALKFTKGNEKVEILFGNHFSGDECIFYLQDNGVGFDMKYAEKLFVPFQRLHNDDEYTGTGIGLATVKRIIDRHNGEVWAQAEKGKGATFYFCLNLSMTDD